MQRSIVLRKKILEIVHRSGASHIGSSLSVVEILSAVYRSVDIDNIRSGKDDRDRVILSKGHSAASLYVTLWGFGLMENKELDSYHSNNSLLGGHVSHWVRYVEHSTGALGHGLPVAVGIGIGLRSRKWASHVYVIVGDGELHEGSNWESLSLAGHIKLNNLCLLIDNNGLGGVGFTSECCTLEPLKERLGSFGLDVYEVNGHNEEEIYSTIQKSKNSRNPVAIICNTVKGKGVSFMENNNIWHYRPPNREEYRDALIEIKAGNE